MPVEFTACQNNIVCDLCAVTRALSSAPLPCQRKLRRSPLRKIKRMQEPVADAKFADNLSSTCAKIYLLHCSGEASAKSCNITVATRSPSVLQARGGSAGYGVLCSNEDVSQNLCNCESWRVKPSWKRGYGSMPLLLFCERTRSAVTW